MEALDQALEACKEADSAGCADTARALCCCVAFAAPLLGRSQPTSSNTSHRMELALTALAEALVAAEEATRERELGGWAKACDAAARAVPSLSVRHSETQAHK